MILTRKTEGLEEKPFPEPLWPPQIHLGVIPDLSDEKPPRNRLTYDTAQGIINVINSSCY
jgi:hypothetical protein